VADAGEHVGDWIVERHLTFPGELSNSKHGRGRTERRPGAAPTTCYQLALRMPGILPSRASLRSMMRLTRNLRYTPRARPVNSHRRTMRLLNLGARFDLAICALVVIA